jgi:hypothetical protein
VYIQEKGYGEWESTQRNYVPTKKKNGFFDTYDGNTTERLNVFLSAKVISDKFSYYF